MNNDIMVLDDSLRVRIYYECDDCDYPDNICVSILEDCPDDEKVFINDETNLYLTPQQAQSLATALINAANQSMGFKEKTSFVNHRP